MSGRKTVKQLVEGVEGRDLRNNTQRVLVSLVRRQGQWVSRQELNARVPSATSRIRDLRTREFGAFRVECKTAVELGKRGGRTQTFYRLASASTEKVERVLRKGVVVSRPR